MILPGAIQTTFQDLRYACRSLLRSPGFAAVVILTLGLGIGLNLTMFSLMRAVLWRPLPYPEPNRIVMLQVDARNVRDTGATMGEVQSLRERSQSLEQVSIISAVDANLEYAGEMEHLTGASVSDDFLPLLGVRPALGRTLNSYLDESSEHVLAVMISNDLWRTRFSADPAIIGRSARINNLEVQIAGVLPAGFRLFLPPALNASERIDVWFPYSLMPASPYRGIPVAARLRRGVSLDQANAELRFLAEQFAREHPEAYATGKARFTARLLHDDMTREARPGLFLLTGAVAFVLLIACVNVANLMLARGAARQRELEIRQALGAGRVQLMRQLLTESMVLGLAAAIVGIFCAGLGLEAIRRVGASHIPLQSRLVLDLPVAVFAFVLAAITSLLFGLVPAWRLASGGMNLPLRAGRSVTSGSSARTLQRILIAAEVALSIVPLACGGLMLRSFLNLSHAPLGFNPAEVVTARVPIQFRRYPQTEQKWALLRDLMVKVHSIPGVRSVSASSPLPLAPNQETRRVGRFDHPDAPPIQATQQVTLPGYLVTMGTDLREGRDFAPEDVALKRDVTIIDESLAKRLWPGEEAIGRRLSIYRTGWRQDLEIVGVTETVRSTRVRDQSIPHFAIPYHIYPVDMSLVVKTGESAEQLAPKIKAAVDAAQTGRAVFDIRSMNAYVSDSIGDTRFILVVLTVFAIASVLLAAVGLYGTLAWLTAQRTREFGIRIALGSTGQGIVAIVLRESVLLAAAGSTAGLIGVAAATGAIRQLLYGVRPLDGLTLISIVVLVGTVALVAAGVPAWRAARIDPQTSLRSE